MLNLETYRGVVPPLIAHNDQVEFAATVAHELRTPLHTAGGFLHFLTQEMAGPLSDLQRDMLASVATSLEQAQALVEDLLCYAHLQHGELKLELAPFDLAELVHQTINQLKLMAGAAEVRLEGPEADGSAHPVYGAQLRLGQCLRNLIVNAIKFSPAGSTVKIALLLSGNEYVIRVEDQGAGIAPDKLQTIFQRHVQGGHKAGPAHLSGYGLGLSISKELVERQGGRIWAESIPGQGSRFYISLPALQTTWWAA